MLAWCIISDTKTHDCPGHANKYYLSYAHGLNRSLEEATFHIVLWSRCQVVNPIVLSFGSQMTGIFSFLLLSIPHLARCWLCCALGSFATLTRVLQCQLANDTGSLEEKRRGEQANKKIK